jgi:uncharacterized protein (DUF1501 family)
MTEFGRRGFLGGVTALGCTAAASPLITPVTFAATPGEARLVVIVLRGAMDGLDVVQPYGDPDLRQWRKSLSQGPEAGAIDLDGFFALHAGLGKLAPLWEAGELSFAHAVCTPYRDGRSHFDGQDFLENGGYAPDGSMTEAENGWLNRLLARIGARDVETAFSVGRERMLLLRGDVAHSSWSPDVDLELTEAGKALLERVYRKDPLFSSAAKAAEVLSASYDGSMNARKAARAEELARFSASRLNQATRIAAFSLGGWDTHRNQTHALTRALGELQTAILTLREELGGNWSKTAVVAMTEFGRTVRENGSAGTDHGTGGVMLMAGGAVRGGQVHGRWPGLAEAELYERRDLMPTDDVRRYAGWVMSDLFELSAADRDAVFAKVDFGERLRLVV